MSTKSSKDTFKQTFRLEAATKMGNTQDCTVRLPNLLNHGKFDVLLIRCQLVKKVVSWLFMFEGYCEFLSS